VWGAKAMKLTKQQFLQAQTALLDGYDRAALRRMLRLGLDASLDEITSGSTDSDIVFDVVEWAERNDQVSALIAAAAEHNPQNAALQQLQQAAAGWFASPSAGPQQAAQTGAPSAPSAPPTAPPPIYAAGGDVIVATIGAGAKDVAVGKNITQSKGDADT